MLLRDRHKLHIGFQSPDIDDMPAIDVKPDHNANSKGRSKSADDATSKGGFTPNRFKSNIAKQALLHHPIHGCSILIVDLYSVCVHIYQIRKAVLLL